MTAVYRLRQGIRALLAAAFVLPVNHDLAAQYLSPELLTLFKQMKRGEQLHSLHVLRAVLAQEATTPPALATAALLHDNGKTRYPVRIWGKMIAVLVRKFAPSLFEKLTHGDPRKWWIRPFVVYAQHPAWSGELLVEHGASQDAVWLATHHADDASLWRDHALYPLLVRLQRADDTN
jgi:hypothetical protein